MAYKPIEDYGMIGDLRTIALVGTDGSIDFMCFPHFDSPTIFAALLDDEKGGRFRISPATDGARLKQLYLPDTNVLVTRFLSDDGVGEVTDFMPVGQMRHTHTIVRHVKAIKGPMRFRLQCAPRFDYARGTHQVEQRDRDVVFLPSGGDVALRLRSSIPVAVQAGDAVAEFSLDSGQVANFILETIRPGVDTPTGDPDYAEQALHHTVRYWRESLARCTYRGRWREMVNRSALTMKMLCSQSTGGIAAAATFGLPEMIGGERNWDYRFTWIRDGSLTAAALIPLGFHDEARRFARWIEDRYADSTDGHLQIMYGIDGRRELTEQSLDHLAGYRGSKPVRIGNGAYDQLQLDIYGELMLFVDRFDEHVEPVTYDLWQKLRTSIEWISANWRRKDEGIWEVRGGQQEFLYSRATSWLAIDRALKIAHRRSLPAPTAAWQSTRDEIHREIYESFWNEGRQAFIQHKQTTTLDSSALLMPLVGLIPPRDPRWLKTLQAIEDELVEDALVYRYRTHTAASDGLSGTEGTFCMCSFWFIECVARSGQHQKARLLFEKMHSYANHLGLYAEEFLGSEVYAMEGLLESVRR